MTLLFPVAGANGTISPGASGFPGNYGTGYFDLGQEYECDFYFNNVSIVAAILNTLDGRGHASAYPLAANTPTSLTIPARQWRVTGNGATLSANITGVPTGR